MSQFLSTYHVIDPNHGTKAWLTLLGPATAGGVMVCFVEDHEQSQGLDHLYDFAIGFLKRGFVWLSKVSLIAFPWIGFFARLCTR
jgi:hypothetical protein